MTLSEVLNAHPFVELWNPVLLLMLLCIAVAYVLLTGPYRSIFPDSDRVHPLCITSFLAALVLIYTVQGSPLNMLGHHYLFSAHMMQMAVMYMVVPPLLMLGLPQWFYRRLLQGERVQRIWMLLTRPIFAIVFFNIMFSFYHFPVIFDTVMHEPVLHYMYHGVLFFASFFMWWPILGLLPEFERLTELRKIGYILAGSVLITPVCALVIFASNPMYTTYMHAPQLFTLLPTLDDQQLGGVVMKLVQEGAFATGLLVILFQWVKRDNSSSRIDPIEPQGGGAHEGDAHGHDPEAAPSGNREVHHPESQPNT